MRCCSEQMCYSMHPKMMLLFFADRLRVVVSTANANKGEYLDIQQCVWVQDFHRLDATSDDSNSGSGGRSGRSSGGSGFGHLQMFEPTASDTNPACSFAPTLQMMVTALTEGHESEAVRLLRRLLCSARALLVLLPARCFCLCTCAARARARARALLVPLILLTYVCACDSTSVGLRSLSSSISLTPGRI
jgi:hypothetical protein